jgi:hypothetical protein
MKMADELCRCASSIIHVVRNFDEARELSKTAATMGRALIHADFVKEEIPKLGKCLGLDLSHVEKFIEQAKKLSAQPTEASAFMELAWRAFSRSVQTCAEKK